MNAVRKSPSGEVKASGKAREAIAEVREKAVPARVRRGVGRVADAGTLATPAPVTVSPRTPIVECAQIMHDRHVGALLVVEDTPGGPAAVGMVTDRDITIEVVAFGLDPTTLTARELMSTPVATVRTSDPPGAALAEMRRRGVRRVAVVDDDGRLVGVLSANDLLATLTAELGAIVDAMRAGRRREGKARSARAG